MSRTTGNAYSYLDLVSSLNGRARTLKPLASKGLQVKEYESPLYLAGKLLTVFTLAAVIMAAYWNWSDLRYTYEVLKGNAWGKVFIYTGQTVFFISIVEFIWRLMLVRSYRPTRTCHSEDLPTCTVIVPAYNEGRGVLRTLRSLARSHYPVAKLEIIAIDDGSKDDTWDWIVRGARELKGRVRTIRLPANKGKRHALAVGFAQARGEIVVTVDSDSLVERRTLRRLVSPFHNEPRVGAVAGNVRVLNRHEGLIPRMLDVSFLYSFDFIRASQSQINTVVCTPGALSAYRRDVIMKILPDWLKQTFCGRTANIAEDRSLTNYILRDGHYIRFQRSAVAYTMVPTRFKDLCKMYIRWARGDVRESLVMSRFLFGKFRGEEPVWGARFNLLLAWMGFTVTNLLVLATLVCLLWQPEVYLLNVLLGTAVASAIPAACYISSRRHSDALWSFAYGAFWLAALSWIGIYSLFTPQKDRWLTREIPSSRPAPAAAEADAPSVLVAGAVRQTA